MLAVIYKSINTITLLFLFINFFNNKEHPIKTFFYFISFVVIFESILLPYAFLKSKYGYNFFAIVCVNYYLYLYYDCLKRFKRFKRLPYLILAYFLVSIIDLIFFSRNESMNNEVYLIGMVIVLILIFILIYNFIKSITKDNIYFNSYLYLSLGIIIFFTASFPLLAFLDILVTNLSVLKIYNTLLQIGNIFLSLGYLGAALCIRKEAQSIG